jgi:hypothetical protein
LTAPSCRRPGQPGRQTFELGPGRPPSRGLTRNSPVCRLLRCRWLHPRRAVRHLSRSRRVRFQGRELCFASTRTRPWSSMRLRSSTSPTSPTRCSWARYSKAFRNTRSCPSQSTNVPSTPIGRHSTTRSTTRTPSRTAGARRRARHGRLHRGGETPGGRSGCARRAPALPAPPPPVVAVNESARALARRGQALHQGDGPVPLRGQLSHVGLGRARPPDRPPDQQHPLQPTRPPTPQPDETRRQRPTDRGGGDSGTACRRFSNSSGRPESWQS